MSETRMTDDEFEGAATLSLSIASPAKINATAAAILVGSRRKTVAEARRARAAETDLAAQLAASQAECERLRSERDAAREALAPFARYPGDYQFRRDPDETVIERHDTGPVLTVGDWRRARAALSPPAPKGEATEAAKEAETKRPKCLNCGDRRNVLDALDEVIPCPTCNPPVKETP